MVDLESSTEIDKNKCSFHFSGRGHERDDLHLLMKRYEEWAFKLIPALSFGDFIEKVLSTSCPQVTSSFLPPLPTKHNIQISSSPRQALWFEPTHVLARAFSPSLWGASTLPP